MKQGDWVLCIHSKTLGKLLEISEMYDDDLYCYCCPKILYKVRVVREEQFTIRWLYDGDIVPTIPTNEQMFEWITTELMN